MSFVSERPTALLWSVAAALFCLALYWQWQSFEADQAVFLVFYLRAAPNFPAGELDSLAPSSASLVMFAVMTGFMVAFALIQWRLPPR
ncbi:hypothetical protein ASD25_02180 [Brevundimonas sp. Root1423]|nr:hypothetical protein ASD25_02180 [Brevundimonas sp. Root1423]